MAGRLTGRRTVVTGGASGIGRAIAAAYLREGAIVVIADIDSAAVDRTVVELSSAGSISGIGCDVTKSAETQALETEVVQHLGGVDVLVNNAGLSG